MPATCLIAGQIVGIGIFLTPAEMAQGLGAPGLVYAMWLLAGFMALTGALCYGELSARFPEAGGAYVYLREAWGEPVAFLYGWKCLLVMDPGITAALAAGLSDYVAYLTPLGPGGRKAVAVAAILLLAAVTALGTRLAASALVLITALKLGVLAVIVVLGFASGQAEAEPAAALLLALRGRARAPARPGRRLRVGLLLLRRLVGGRAHGGRGARPRANPAPRLRPGHRHRDRGLHPDHRGLPGPRSPGRGGLGRARSPPGWASGSSAQAGGTVLALAVIVSVLGSLAAVMLMTPRVYVALARDGLFPARLARLAPPTGHARHRHRPAGRPSPACS